MYEFKEFEFLWHEKLADGLYRVVEDWGGPQKICMYVVIGEDKVAVVDTGCGATQELRKYIETYITGKKPMIALMTHSHPDHIGGCTLFDEQYIHPVELPQLAWNLNNKRRVHDAAAFAFTGMPGSDARADLDRAMAVWKYCEGTYIPVDYKSIDWKLLEDGDKVDLGGTVLECVFMNAHGSLVFYNREKDYALCGDNVTYTLAYGNITEDLIGRFEKFIAHFMDKTMFYSGHLFYEDMMTRPQEIDAGMIRELIEAMRTVVAGGDFEDAQPVVHHVVEGAPTLAGHVPDEDDEEGWAAFRAGHPERKGEVPQPGKPFVHHIGPILFTYKKVVD